MSDARQTLEFRFERTIPAPVDVVFDAWLDPQTPGNPWHTADKLILDPRVDGLFYWAYRTTPHFGRFTAVERPRRMQHTWMSPNTLGKESVVTVTFDPQGTGTRMVLVHTGLPDSDAGRGHQNGWNFFLDGFTVAFADGPTRDASVPATS